MKKVLFIDRDGTLIIEPPHDFQIDSLEDLEFLPHVISALRRIAQELDYELVMVTNQDGLGTDSLPEAHFWPPHHKMLKTFEGEQVLFKEVLIDRTFEHENAPTRKPRTGLLKHYLDNPEYDLANSFVIGDRLSDALLAKNLGAQAILISAEAAKVADWQQNQSQLAADYPLALVAADWYQIYDYLKGKENASRMARVLRQTKETDIFVQIHLEGSGKHQLHTGIGFFDHMLEQLARHARLDLEVQVIGDLHIDEHHTIEDTALALGEAFLKAMGDKRGMERYGHSILPMDEALAQVAIDFSGRPWLVWQADFKREKVGGMPTEMFEHFFKSFSDTAKCNLNIQVSGRNEHHLIEAIFKAWARAIRMALRIDASHMEIPSTKGVL
jgi:imidazoleglycerol-phosphate dehydratase/histidinol-phosphatase